MNREARWIVLVVVVVLGILAWGDDFITLQGEHTIYTARCVDGNWDGVVCSGHLRAGERYRYRALRARSEVLFWMVGSSEPSGKFTGCLVTDGRNWSCKPNDDAARSITLTLVHGRAQHDTTGATRPFYAVSKWKWWCLRVGLGTFTRASY